MSFTDSKAYGEYQHTLTINEMPRHDHAVKTGVNQTSIVEKYGIYPFRSADMIDESKSTYTYYSGESKSHNNIQPSLVVFFWQRIK